MNEHSIDEVVRDAPVESSAPPFAKYVVGAGLVVGAVCAGSGIAKENSNILSIGATVAAGAAFYGICLYVITPWLEKSLDL